MRLLIRVLEFTRGEVCHVLVVPIRVGAEHDVVPRCLSWYDASSECETARQHKVAGVVSYRGPERMLAGCADPLLGGGVCVCGGGGSMHPISILENNN